MSDLNQIKGIEVPARVTYTEGTINPASLYDAAPINLCVQVPVDFLTPRHDTQEDVRTALNAVPSEYMTKAEKRACIKLYPSNKQLGIEPPPQMGFQFNACRLSNSVMRRLNKRDRLSYRCRH